MNSYIWIFQFFLFLFRWLISLHISSPLQFGLFHSFRLFCYFYKNYSDILQLINSLKKLLNCMHIAYIYIYCENMQYRLCSEAMEMAKGIPIISCMAISCYSPCVVVVFFSNENWRNIYDAVVLLFVYISLRIAPAIVCVDDDVRLIFFCFVCTSSNTSARGSMQKTISGKILVTYI